MIFARHAVKSFAFAALSIVGTTQLQAQSVYYEGTSQYTLPDGRTVPGGAVLVKRTQDERASTIVEQVVSGATRTRPATEYVVNVRVNGAKFTMTEAGGAFDGDGTLQGPAWNWNAWTSLSKLKDGSRVESIDSSTATTLIVHKRVMGADGSDQVRTNESYKVIDEARFIARRKELLGQ